MAYVSDQIAVCDQAVLVPHTNGSLMCSIGAAADRIEASKNPLNRSAKPSRYLSIVERTLKRPLQPKKRPQTRRSEAFLASTLRTTRLLAHLLGSFDDAQSTLRKDLTSALLIIHQFVSSLPST